MAERTTTTAQDLLKRWEAMDRDFSTVATQCQEIADYIAPSKAVITRTATPGQAMTSFVFDGEAIRAAKKLAAHLAGAMTSPSQPFFSLSLAPPELAEHKETQDWMGEVKDRLYEALGRSDFHACSLALFEDLCHFGMAALFEEEKAPLVTGEFGGLRFLNIPVGEFRWAEDADGHVDTFFRKFTLPARAAYGKWGDKAGPKVVASATEQAKNQEEPFEFLHCIYPRMYRDRQKKTGPHMPWASYYVSVADKAIIEEGGYRRFPIMAPRWDKVPGQVYGYGPSHDTLPDVRSVNVVKELLLKAAPLKMQPPTIEKVDALAEDPDLTPGGRNRSENGPADFQFMDTRGDVRLDQIVLADLHQAIADGYYITALQLKDSPQMTATEVLALREQLERFLGPVAGRIESEYLNPLVVRTFELMWAANALPPAPQAVRDWMRQHAGLAPELDIRYEGPLQRNRRALDAVAYTALYQQLPIVAQFDPSVVHVFKHRDIMRDFAEIRGIASKYARDEKEVLQLMQAQAQAQQAQAQLDQAQQLADSLGKVAPLAKVLQGSLPPGGGGAFAPAQAA